jgi:hypothetical protein
LGDGAGDERRERDAEISPQAVDAHDPADARGIEAGQHGITDGMIDGGEDADQRERRADL